MQISKISESKMYTFTTTISEDELLDMWQEYKVLQEADNVGVVGGNVPHIMEFVRTAMDATVNKTPVMRGDVG